MARIKKKGLDYFPLNTDFIHDRAEIGRAHV